jgi:hypothetical protein
MRAKGTDMRGQYRVLVLLCGFFLAIPLAVLLEGQQSDREIFTPLTKLPIVADGGEIGDLLSKWYSKGTAAGNTGDYYDNRDGGHSLLSINLYPQLHMVEYSETQIKSRQNWGLQRQILPFVVFGNSSTSAPPEQGGSNVRRYYSDPKGVAFLFAQYVHNNLYIYPEHRDHDPGHNGVGGYGDLYPTNTPYLITSQGSSGSDQPFMQALPYVLAAFHPDVKKKLIQSGMLMPVIQMILRITNNQTAGARDYLTGKAHPTVFEGSGVNAQAMTEMAHSITISTLPPIALIRVEGEDTPVNDVDYFDPKQSEKLADTPAVIARIFRGSAYARKITISAEDSKELNNRPLKFHWQVLRGDPDRIKIEYLNPTHSSASITVPYFERRPIAANSGLESNRVDIGVFVHNGIYYSPPAFVTFYTLDNEARTYRADGRPEEIAYGTGTASISVADWRTFFETLECLSESWPCKFLRKQFTEQEIAALFRVGEEHHKIQQLLAAAQNVLKKAEAEQKAEGDDGKALPAKQAARKTISDAQQAEAQLLKQKMPSLNVGAAELVQKALDSLLQDPSLWRVNSSEIESLYRSGGKEAGEAFNQIRANLITFGVAEDLHGSLFRLKLLDGSSPSARPTRYEEGMIARLNGVLLSRLIFPGILNSDWRPNYVDRDLFSAKEWRDVYRYAPDGTPAGWRRYQSSGVMDFNSDGLLVLNRDSLGRCIKARIVRYDLEPDRSDPNGRAQLVKMVLTDTIREYGYLGANDWKGFIKSR